MKMLVFAVCCLSLLATGCASTETVKEARGQGVSRSYPLAYDRVFDAVQSPRGDSLAAPRPGE